MKKLVFLAVTHSSYRYFFYNFFKTKRAIGELKLRDKKDPLISGIILKSLRVLRGNKLISLLDLISTI